MSKKPVDPFPIGLSGADRKNLRGNIGLELALDHIDAIYQQQVLYVYGCGLVLGLVSDEFDKFMALEPSKQKSSSSAWLSNVLVGILKSFAAAPPFSAVVGTVATVAEGVLAVTYFVAEPPSPDYPEPNRSVAAYLREKSLKVPFFQNVLSRRFQIEYERINKRKEFLTKLDQELQNPKFTGTPQTLAIEMCGPIPKQLTPEQINALFLKLREKLFKAMLQQYVRDNVTIFWNRKQYLPGRDYENEYYTLGWGLNYEQWAWMYARFGTKPTPEQRNFLRLFTNLHNIMPFSITGMIRTYYPAPDPILTGIIDLWRLWGAKRQEWDQTWYGDSNIRPAKY